MQIIFRNFNSFLHDKKNLCKYCKNKIKTLDEYIVYNDRCKKFIVPNTKLIDIYYELAYKARKDEDKCGKFGKYFEDKYFSKK
jgi:hypothetical protein